MLSKHIIKLLNIPRADIFILPLVLAMPGAISILSTDMYAPSLPDLVSHFETTSNKVNLTMSLNLLIYSIAHLVYGPLSDVFGRKLILQAGLHGFLISTIFCSLASSVEWLIVARMLQGGTAAAQSVIVIAIIRDRFTDEDGVKIIALCGMYLSVTPAIGPLIGVNLHYWLGWQSNFIFIAVFTLTTIILIHCFIHESASVLHRRLTSRMIVVNYYSLSTNKMFLAYALSSGFVCAGQFGYIAAAPFVFIDGLGVGIRQYGVYQILPIIGLFIGNHLARKLVQMLDVERLMQLGLWVGLISVLPILVAISMGINGLFYILLSASLMFVGIAINFATVPLLALNESSVGRGFASSMLGMIQFGGGAFGVLVAGWFHSYHVWAIVVVIGCSGVGATLVYILTKPLKS